jgi:hypothetical protein
MNTLPESFLEFIKSHKEFEYDTSKCECGLVKLKSIDELKKGEVWLEVSSNNKVYIEIPAISLLKDCEGYEPDYILLWLPNEKCFGTWDCDHWELRIFPDTEWGKIVSEPGKYLSAGWYDNHEEYTSIYNPIDKYPKIDGWPF